MQILWSSLDKTPNEHSEYKGSEGWCTDILTLACWTRIYPVFGNSVDPDQLEEANWSVSALFLIKYVNLY